jgi:hypothetical protein
MQCERDNVGARREPGAPLCPGGLTTPLPHPVVPSKKAGKNDKMRTMNEESIQLTHLETRLHKALSTRWKAEFGKKAVLDENQAFRLSLSSRLASAFIISFRLLGIHLPEELIDLDNLYRYTKEPKLITLWKNFLAWPMTLYVYSTQRRTEHGARIIPLEAPDNSHARDYTYVLGGNIRSKLKGWVTNPRRSKRILAHHICESLLRLKRCSPTVPDSFIKEVLEEHSATLSKVDPIITDWNDLTSQEEIFERVSLIVKYLFNRKRKTTTDSHIKEMRYALHKTHIPTRSSTYENTRQDMGALGHWASKEKAPPSNWELELPILHSLSYDPYTQKVSSFHVPSILIQDEDEVQPPVDVALFRELQHLYTHEGEVIGNIFDAKDALLDPQSIITDDVKAIAIPIPEPLKVRVITKGNELPYYEAQSLQKLLTSLMKRGSIAACFPSLRGPLDISDINRKFKGYSYYLSGDYKGATDTLRKDVSEHCINAILSATCLPELAVGSPMGDLMRRCLTEHTIEYLDKKGNVVNSIKQQTGQLMGSFLSFPVLCIINLAINWYYLDPFQDHKPWELPLYINGDDVLAASNEPFPNWAETVGLVGFKKSLGKNYISDHMFCINSEFYLLLVDEDARQQIVRVETVATECIFAQSWYKELDRRTNKRAVGTIFDNSPHHVGALCRHLLETSSSSRQVLAFNLFTRMNHKKLTELGRPWFVPVELGGLGLPAIEENRGLWLQDATTTAYILRLMHTKNIESPMKKLRRTNEITTMADEYKASLSSKYLRTFGWKLTPYMEPTIGDYEHHESRPELPDFKELPWGFYKAKAVSNENVSQWRPKKLIALAQHSGINPVDLTKLKLLYSRFGTLRSQSSPLVREMVEIEQAIGVHEELLAREYVSLRVPGSVIDFDKILSEAGVELKPIQGPMDLKSFTDATHLDKSGSPYALNAWRLGYL